MSKVRQAPSLSRPARKPPHRLIIARGENVRTITIRPWLMGSLAAAGAVFGILYLGATFYLVFRDDLLAASIARQARIQHAYEDRIAALRTDIDRLTSRQLINQQAFDAKMDRLSDRQAALDARQDIIAGLSQAARRVGVAPAPAAVQDKAESAPAKDPMVTGSVVPTPGAKVAPFIAAFLRPSHADAAVPAVAAPAGRIGAVEQSLDNLAAEQVAYVEDVAIRTREKTDKIASILTRLGHKALTARADGGVDVGGPFVPLPANADPQTFRSGVELVTAEIEDLASVRRAANRLPLTRPVALAPITSRFGVRLDPFLGRPAMHTGIDFRATIGYPVRATAAGTVVTAEYTGGYGNMVEVDHGNGLTTRYAHMNAILVKPGEVIDKGTVVGRVGSTGRSTGPHVHYEVRVDGEALDPLRYIRAGGEIAPLL